ncbi:hypothetical protein E1H13_17760 [Nodosilinea sp. P-1105]|nr:hypothetical protein [Nodosilinea sp. P-1105]
MIPRASYSSIVPHSTRNRYKPIQNAWATLAEVPTQTAISDAISQDLKRRGFRFVGSTICYAYMQAAGLVNDHTVDCFRHQEIKAMSG